MFEKKEWKNKLSLYPSVNELTLIRTEEKGMEGRHKEGYKE
jgi:hypothetical protein